jgi:hypothetical protein
MNPQGRALVVGAAWITPIIPKPARRRRGPPPPPTSPDRRLPPPEPRRRRLRARAEPSRAVEREGHTERGRGSCLAGGCRGSRSVPVRCGDAVAEAWLFIGSTALRAGASAIRRSGTGGGVVSSRVGVSACTRLRRYRRSIDPPRPRRHAARNSANKRN